MVNYNLLFNLVISFTLNNINTMYMRSQTYRNDIVSILYLIFCLIYRQKIKQKNLYWIFQELDK